MYPRISTELIFAIVKGASEVKMFFSRPIPSFLFSFSKVSSILVIFPAPSKRVGGAKEPKYLFPVPSNRLIFRVLFERTE